MTKQEQSQQALSNAVSNSSVMNYASIFTGFMSRGIPESDIKPRENVFTYKAWLALNRQVRKGEHGVKVVTFVPMTKEDKATGEKKSIGRHAWTTTVFHVSQTDPIDSWESRVRTYENEGCTRSDAQGIVDAEDQRELDATSENVPFAGE